MSVETLDLLEQLDAELRAAEEATPELMIYVNLLAGARLHVCGTLPRGDGGPTPYTGKFTVRLREWSQSDDPIGALRARLAEFLPLLQKAAASAQEPCSSRS